VRGGLLYGIAYIKSLRIFTLLMREIA